MSDLLRCLNCGHTWYPRYRPKNTGLRKCPKCKKVGQYDVLSLWQQTKSGYKLPGLPAGSERTGCLPIIFLLIFIISIIAN